MTYLQANNRNGLFRGHRTRWAILIFVVLLILIEWSFPHFLPAIFTTIVRPFWRVEFSISNGSLSSPQAILAENEDLKRKLSELSVRSQTVQTVVAENDELKALLKRVNQKPVLAIATTIATTKNATSTPATSSASILLKPSPYVLAAVLKRPPLAPYDELVIDLGQDDGVSVGNLVYAPGNVVIGRVADILGQTSKVALFSSPDMSYNILIGDKRVPAVAYGRGGGQFSVQVSRDVVVNVGDIVTVSSIDNKTIGTVGSVIVDPAQPFETIIFTSLANIYEMRWALVDVRVDTKSAKR